MATLQSRGLYHASKTDRILCQHCSKYVELGELKYKVVQTVEITL
jgi:hypothetical protein